MPTSIRLTLILVATTLLACSSTSTTQPPDGHGGSGGASAQSARRGGADFVAAGNRSTDSGHTAVSSLGQSPGGNGVSRSSKYQFVGGLVATTQR